MKNISFQLHPRVDYTKGLMGMLTVKEIKNLLTARKVDITGTGMFDKHDILNALATSLPKHSPRQDGIVWRSKWKASFIVAEWDSKRIILTKDELCNAEWNIRFRQWPAEEESMWAKFNPDYTYTSQMIQPGHSMKWRFYANDVQVESYPELKISRAKDWRFVMQNMHAILYQV
ncbi:hypothetical protein HDU83_004590 [Entophlyctis luteolus]|nr:hypothetical protein HDU83_004590 [Entophlyctis luteolus]